MDIKICKEIKINQKPIKIQCNCICTTVEDENGHKKRS